jgi:hypothetical protein
MVLEKYYTYYCLSHLDSLAVLIKYKKILDENSVLVVLAVVVEVEVEVVVEEENKEDTFESYFEQ